MIVDRTAVRGEMRDRTARILRALHTLRDDGKAAFVVSTSCAVPNAVFPASVDLDGDGAADLVVAEPDYSSIAVFLSR